MFGRQGRPGRIRVLGGWWRGAAVLAAIPALLGCARPRSARPQLLHDAMVARVEVVAEHAGPDDRNWRPGSGDSESPPHVIGLYNGTPTMRGGGRGGGMRGRMGGSRREAAMIAIRTFDAQGGRFRILDTRSVAPGEAIVEVTAEWDEARPRAGVWIRTDSAAYIGLVDPSSARFERLMRVDDVAVDAGAPHILWRGSTLIVCYEAEGANVVVEVETESGDARRVLVEERWDPSLTPMDRAYLSPDGRFLAFDRARSPSSMAMGGRCSGIWLLDLGSGECVELTYEDTSDYRHRLLGWGGPDTLLFTRRVEDESPTPSHDGYLRPVYRAYLALPGAG